MTSPRSEPAPAHATPVAAGGVGRPHGLDGSFHVTAPKPRLLAAGTPVTLGGRQLQIERRAGTDKAPIVRLSGISDRAAVEAVKGTRLLVEETDLPQLEPGEWWAHELAGCTVRDGDAPLGTVTRMIELPSCEALEVQRPGHAAPLLVPMVRDAVRKVDMQRRDIDVDLGFLGEPR